MKYYDWTNRLPADERETALLEPAYRSAFYFLLHSLSALWIVALSLPVGSTVSRGIIIPVMLFLMLGAYLIGWYQVRDEQITGEQRKTYQKGAGLIGWFFVSVWYFLALVINGTPALWYPGLMFLIASTYVFAIVLAWKQLSSLSTWRRAVLSGIGAIPMIGISLLQKPSHKAKWIVGTISVLCYLAYITFYIAFVQTYLL